MRCELAPRTPRFGEYPSRSRKSWEEFENNKFIVQKHNLSTGLFIVKEEIVNLALRKQVQGTPIELERLSQ